ncbi:MAG TPA: GDSL-type esterase/lipase family protein [Candidatus Thermoplasmatota archaeon]|nr:GDSL-type esterase/lipase family protein [Candidatus Thermoplasmatota archaeon]
MRPPALVLALVLALVAAGCASPKRERGLPDGIAVLGDSISRATNVQGDSFGDQPLHSWATGNDANDPVLSHFERLKALDPSLDVVAFNDARPGARMADMQQQAREAAKQRARYVVVLLGANDVCAGTAISEFSAELHTGAAALAELDATVLVASVPDVPELVELYGDNATARAVWSAFDVCPRVLARGADLAAARALIDAYDAALRDEAQARGWMWDGGAVHDVAYERADVSTVDYFHPSLAGQARLAEATWNAGPYARWPAHT